MRIVAQVGSNRIAKPYLTLPEQSLAFGILSKYDKFLTLESINIDLLGTLTDRKIRTLVPVSYLELEIIEKMILGNFYKFYRRSNSLTFKENFRRNDFTRFCHEKDIVTRIRFNGRNAIYEEVKKDFLWSHCDLENCIF